MVMSTDRNKVFGTAILLAMLLAAFAAFAQDEVEDIGPAVDTSAVEPQESESATPDSIEPAVEPSATGNAITRSTAGNRVMDSIELGRTEITGNQELPKVMYIVPWQKANPGDLMGKPINTLLDEVLAPIDREEFLRRVDYYDDLNGESKQE
jgi:hypothetical protein